MKSIISKTSGKDHTPATYSQSEEMILEFIIDMNNSSNGNLLLILWGGFRKAWPALASSSDAQGKGTVFLLQCWGAGEEGRTKQTCLQSGQPLTCEALHIVTNVFPSIPQSDNYMGMGMGVLA